MSDFHRNEGPRWLEQELRDELAPVAAPDSLWRQVQQRRAKPRHRNGLWIFLPAFALMLLSVAAGTAWKTTAQPAPAEPRPWRAVSTVSQSSCPLCHTGAFSLISPIGAGKL